MSAYAVVRKECPIKFDVRSADEVEVTIGGGDKPLMILFDNASFGAFLERGAPALQRMGTLDAREQSGSE